MADHPIHRLRAHDRLKKQKELVKIYSNEFIPSEFVDRRRKVVTSELMMKRG